MPWIKSITGFYSSSRLMIIFSACPLAGSNESMVPLQTTIGSSSGTCVSTYLRSDLMAVIMSRSCVPAPATTAPGLWPPAVDFCELLYCDEVHCCPSVAADAAESEATEKSVVTGNNALTCVSTDRSGNTRVHASFCSSTERNKLYEKLRGSGDCE